MIRRDALLQTYVREKALRSIISSAHGKSSRLFNSTESHAILPVETVFQQPASPIGDSDGNSEIGLGRSHRTAHQTPRPLNPAVGGSAHHEACQLLLTTPVAN